MYFTIGLGAARSLEINRKGLNFFKVYYTYKLSIPPSTNSFPDVYQTFF